MTALTPDPKPWQCVNCSDRFATQTSPQHIYIFQPRASYTQNREDYSS